jgi:hypothetical protein
MIGFHVELIPRIPAPQLSISKNEVWGLLDHRTYVTKNQKTVQNVTQRLLPVTLLSEVAVFAGKCWAQSGGNYPYATRLVWGIYLFYVVCLCLVNKGALYWHTSTHHPSARYTHLDEPEDDDRLCLYFRISCTHCSLCPPSAARHMPVLLSTRGGHHATPLSYLHCSLLGCDGVQSGRRVEDMKEGGWFLPVLNELWPPLWSSGQTSWLQTQRSGFDSRRYQIFWVAVGLERGPLSPCDSKCGATWKKSSDSGLENWD